MSVHSNHYEDPEEYERDLRAEYAREEYEERHGIEIPFYTHQFVCQECEYFKTGKRFVREACGDKIKTTKKRTYFDLCIKDLDNIKEIHSYDDVCPEHGELYAEED